MMKLDSDHPYSELARVLAEALDDAAIGKGQERHASPQERFEDQPIAQLGAWLKSNHFEIGQACKKAIESTRLPFARAKAELLGAINYLAAGVLVLERIQEWERSAVQGSPSPSSSEPTVILVEHQASFQEDEDRPSTTEGIAGSPEPEKTCGTCKYFARYGDDPGYGACVHPQVKVRGTACREDGIHPAWLPCPGHEPK